MNPIRTLLAATVFVFAACLPTPIDDESKDASQSEAALSGSAEVNLELEQSATLAKRNDLVMRKICLSMTSSVKDTLVDTIAVSAGSGYSGTRNYPALASDRTWTLAAKSLDAKDSVLHAGSVAFIVDAGKTKTVKLSLVSHYAMLKIKLAPLQAGMTRCELAADGALIASVNLPAGVKDGDSASLAYDYLRAGTNVFHDLVLSVFSNAPGHEEKLYSGKAKVNFGSTPGQDQTLSIKLDYLGAWVATGAVQGSLALGASATISLRGEIPATPKPKGLVAWYTMEGNFDDVSGFGNNGVTNSISNATWATAGSAGKVLVCDGVQDFFKVPHSASLASTSAVTAAAWVDPASTVGIQTVVGKWYSPDSWRLGITDGFFEFSVAFPGGGQWGTPVTVRAPAPVPSVMSRPWTHIAGTFDGMTVKLYVNGKLAASAAALGQQMQASIINVTVGDNSDKGLNGMVDEIRIYDYPLTESEIGVLKTPEANYRAP